MKTFFHAGDFGDIIYSMCAMKALGGGMLYMGHAPINTRERMTQERCDIIAPLLLVQPYVKGVEYLKDVWHEKGKLGPDVDYNLNTFRMFWDRSNNLVEMALLANNLPLELYKDPWLTVDKQLHLDRPVVIHCKKPGTNLKFPWKDIMIKYAWESVFVGLPSEYEAFQKEVPVRIPYQPTHDFLELARIIAGCRLFIGTESSPFAIAEGLKKAAIVDCIEGVNNCKFRRSNLGVNEDIFTQE